MSGCETLATKAELFAIRNELLQKDQAILELLRYKLDKTEKQSIINEAVGRSKSLIEPQIIALGAIVAGLGSRLTQLLGRLAALDLRIAAIAALLLAIQGVFIFVQNTNNSIEELFRKISGLEGAFAGLDSRVSEHDRLIAILKTVNEILRADVSLLKRQLAQAYDAIREARVIAKDARNTAGIAEVYSRSAISKADTAIKSADAANDKANSATDRANLALREASLASKDAELASQKADAASKLANRAIQQINRLVTSINQQIEQINRRMAKIQQQTLPLIPFTQRVDQNTQDIRNLDNNVRSGVVTTQWSPTVWRSGILQPTVIEPILGETTAITTRIYGDTRQVINANAGATARDITRLSDDARRLSEKITTLEQTQTATNQKVNEQAQVNNDAIPLLRDIQRQVGQIPIAVPAAVGAIVPTVLIGSQRFTQRLVDAAAEGTCQTTKPGGCMGNQFNRQNGKLDDLLRKADLGIQAGQGALLNTINSTVNRIDLKMGSQIVGGISGGMTRLSSFLGIDRLFNLLNFLATLHNASMLSASLKITLLETLSSVGNATGLLQTSEGENVDLNAVFNQGIETFVTSLIGAEAWASMKLTWRKYSSIYRAGSNVLSNVGNMFSSIGNGIEVAAEHTGKIGNALRAAGVVRENAYNYFSEKVNVHTNKFMTFQTTVGGATQVLEAINEIAENTIEGQQAYTEAVKATTEFKKQLSDAEKNPGIDNKAIKLEADKIKENLVKDPTGEDDQGLLSFLTD